MKHLLTAAFIASALTFAGNTGVMAQSSNANDDPACNATGMGADPRCTGVVARGSIRDARAFRAYVVQQRHPAVSIPGVSVGMVLPASGYTYYDVPTQFEAPGLSYVVVDGRTVLLDRSSRRVVSIID